MAHSYALKNDRLQISTNHELKTDANTIFKELQLDMSTAVNMFLVQVVKNKGIPFEISTISTREKELETFQLEMEKRFESMNSGEAVPADNVRAHFEGKLNK